MLEDITLRWRGETDRQTSGGVLLETEGEGAGTGRQTEI